MKKYYPLYDPNLAENITYAAKQIYYAATTNAELHVDVVNVEDAEEIANVLNDLFNRATYKSIIEKPCQCGGTMTGEGRLATGKKLRNGYQPEVNEILEVFFIQCDNCGHWENNQ